MKAKLVTFTFCTRVIVDDDATEEQVIDFAQKNMKQRLDADFRSEMMDNHTKTEDDACDPAIDTPDLFGYHATK